MGVVVVGVGLDEEVDRVCRMEVVFEVSEPPL